MKGWNGLLIMACSRRKALVAAISCIPIVGGAAGVIGDKYLPYPQISRLFKSVEGLEREMSRLKENNQASLINCLSSGWDMFSLDSIWIEHKLPVSFSVRSLKDKKDWDARVTALREPNRVPSDQFDRLLNYCYPPKIWEERRKTTPWANWSIAHLGGTKSDWN